MERDVDRIRVLHVDDDPDFTDLVATFLERADDRFDVETAASAREGLDRLSDRVDCVVSDYEMPGCDGIAFLEDVRETYPDLPFVLFTGKGSEAVASEAITAGATDYLRKGGTERYGLLANRVRNAVERYRSERRATTLERIREIVRDVNQALVRASSREEVEARVCEILADADPYRLAVCSEVDEGTKRVEPHTWAGEGAGYLDGFEMVVAEDAAGRDTPGGRAFHDREVAVSQELGSDPAYERWRDLATEHGFEALAVVPLEYEGDLYGLLAVFADRPHAFDDRERELLTELGDDVTHALHTQEVKAELRRKERRFDAVFEDPQMLVGLLAPDGTLLRTNETSTAYVDADRDEVCGRPFPETPWWTDEVASDVQQWIERAADGEYVEYEADLVRPDGSPFAVRGTVRPVTDDADEVVSLVVSARDVTERRERERRLERHREYTDRLLDAVDDLFYVFDGNGTLRRWNRSCTEVTGYSDEEMAGMSAADFVPESERERAVTEMGRVFETGSGRIEVSLLTEDGSTVPYEFVANRVETVDGDPRLVGVGRDVSDREALRERYELLVAASTDAFWDWDPRTDEITRSDQYLTQFGYEKSAVGATTDWWRDRIHPDDREAVLDALDRALADPEATYDEVYRFRRADGTYGYLRSRGTVVYDDDGDPERMVGAHIDITKLMEARQELERQNERLDEFASVVSHDLRNPLSVAQGRVELAREECDSQHLEDVAAAHDRMATLVDDLLALAREENRVENVESIDLANLVENCWRNVATADATLVTATDRHIRGDRSRLQQLLENLIGNAVEHGGDRVTVTVGDLDEGTGFYVADDGSGIPAAERERVFERGYSTLDGGTGFGLAIVEEVADAHGWTVDVTESASGGTRFEVDGVTPAE